MIAQLPKATIFSSLVLVIVGALLVYDSKFHFDAEIVRVKSENYSAQRHWNSNYTQGYVYKDSSIRYDQDFSSIKNLIRPNSVLLSDLATSYFAAAMLPVHVVNIHRHQGRNRWTELINFLDKQYLCYMEFEENRQHVSDFFKGNSDLDYVLINKDRINGNRERDCLAFRSDTMIEHLPKFSNLLWEGEFLNLYSVRDRQD